ncbi:hypothetical protein CURTO8I2_150095 [Curtobacterium sp. 8I-2]|nr:hypothetical protein CURTO8I2_150095 [Curtobacterium sp. 8I-2]
MIFRGLFGPVSVHQHQSERGPHGFCHQEAS